MTKIDILFIRLLYYILYIRSVFSAMQERCQEDIKGKMKAKKTHDDDDINKTEETDENDVLLMAAAEA